MNITIDANVTGASQQIAQIFASVQYNGSNTPKNVNRTTRVWCSDTDSCPIPVMQPPATTSTNKIEPSRSILALYNTPISMQSTKSFSLASNLPFRIHFVYISMINANADLTTRISKNMNQLTPTELAKIVLLIEVPYRQPSLPATPLNELYPLSRYKNHYRLRMGNFTFDTRIDLVASIVLAHSMMGQTVTMEQLVDLVQCKARTCDELDDTKDDSNEDEPMEAQPTTNQSAPSSLIDAYRLLQIACVQPEDQNCSRRRQRQPASTPTTPQQQQSNQMLPPPQIPAISSLSSNNASRRIQGSSQSKNRGVVLDPTRKLAAVQPKNLRASQTKIPGAASQTKNPGAASQTKNPGAASQTKISAASQTKNITSTCNNPSTSSDGKRSRVWCSGGIPPSLAEMRRKLNAVDTQNRKFLSN